MLPEKLNKKLEKRKTNNAFRTLGESKLAVDFSSNDYLGFSKSEIIFESAHRYLVNNQLLQNGSTGSRLLSGNHKLYNEVEAQIAETHQTEACLIYNSGYGANIGLLSCVPQRNDCILYDEYSHASIRAGIQISHAKSYKFQHNNLKDLERQLQQFATTANECYVITESVFSMDGDAPNLVNMVRLCHQFNARLIVDEAHALGVFGKGLVQKYELQNKVFARIITFGKALGCHGAAILGSKDLKAYLVNFSGSLIYTTALPPHSLATLKVAYNTLETTAEIDTLSNNIILFKSQVKKLKLQHAFIESNSAIQSILIPENAKVKAIAKLFAKKGFDVKPILSPTVPLGKERLRFCLHSYNTPENIRQVLALLAKFTAYE